MALAIRLSRGGAKKRPFYRIVVADSRMPRDGRFLERLGTYDPMIAKDDPKRVSLNTERILYWVSVGARPSDRIAGFLYQAKIGPKPIIYEQTKQNKPRARTVEKMKEREEKLAAKAQAAAIAPAPVAEAKAEEKPAPAEDTEKN